MFVQDLRKSLASGQALPKFLGSKSIDCNKGQTEFDGVVLDPSRVNSIETFP